MKKILSLGSLVFIAIALLLVLRRETTAHLLQRVTQGQELRALVLQLPPQSRCFIVSNIQGESNSLKKILDQWRTMGILKNHTITEPKSYLMFNGNCIGPTRDNKEVLRIIATLMRYNPSQVFYIAGPHERHEWWLDKIDLSPTILRPFFNSLPLGLYIVTQDNTQPIRISYEGSDASIFNRVACTASEEGVLKATCLLGELCSFTHDKGAYYIVGEETGIDWSTMQGLQRSSTTWHIVSSSTLSYKEKYRFFNDSFALLTIGNTLADCTITSYYTTMSHPETFSQNPVWYLDGKLFLATSS